MKICLSIVKYEGQWNIRDITFNSLFIYAHAVGGAGGSAPPHRNWFKCLPQQRSWTPVKSWCLRLEPAFSPCRIFISEPVIFTLWPLGKGIVLLPPRGILLQVEWLKSVFLGVWDKPLFFLHQLLCDLSSYCSSCLWNRTPLFMDWITGNASVCELLIKKTARSNLQISLSYKTQL